MATADEGEAHARAKAEGEVSRDGIVDESEKIRGGSDVEIRPHLTVDGHELALEARGPVWMNLRLAPCSPKWIFYIYF